MKLNINAVLDGSDILEDFIKQLKDKKIEVARHGDTNLPLNIKILVFSDKAGKEIEIAPDKLKFIFNV